MKKKLLSLALAAAMVMGMATTGLAASTNGTSDTDMSEVHILKTYKLNGVGSSPEEVFTVEVDSSEVVTGEAEIAPSITSITGANFSAGEATTDGVTKDIVVTLPQYENVGVYKYILSEVSTNDTTGVTYATNTITLVVTVINGDDENVRIGAVHTETITYDEETGEVTSAKTDGIINTYTANSLNVTKTVTGNLGDTEKEFEFEVTFTNPSDNGNWKNAITLPEGATLKEDTENTYKFKLKHGATATFGNIPEGVEYSVTEGDYTSDGYTTTSSGGNGTMTSEAATAAFTNNKTGPVDTGIDLDTLPYIIILAVVLAGAAYMVFRKRMSNKY